MMAIDLNYLVDVIFILIVWTLPFASSNIFYRFAEHTMVALTLGWYVVNVTNSVWNVYLTAVFNKGDLISLVGVLVGILILTKLYKPVDWIARTPMAILVGVSAGLMMRGFLGAQFIKQIENTMVPLTSIKAIVIFVLAFAGVFYFLFTVKYDKISALNYVAKLGRIGMMLFFGASYITYGHSRIEYLSYTLQVVLYQFLGLKPG